MLRLVLTLLGGFEARSGSGGPIDLTAKKVKALLAYLALDPGRMHPRPSVAELLWGEAGQQQARNSLRQALAVLRRALGAARVDVLIEGRGEVGVDASLIDLDVTRLEKLLAAGGGEALALYRGDLLTGLVSGATGFDDWLAAERERLRDRALTAFDRLLDDQILTSPAAAFETARRLLALDAVRESAHRALMRLHAGEGRLGDAIRQYRTCVVVLRRELSVEPSTPTRRLYQEILERQRLPPGARGPRGRIPAETRGAHGRLPSRETPLVGRSAELSAMDAALTAAMEGRGRVVAVLGEAGIGKSRLVAELGHVALGRGARLLVGRCRDTEQVLPLHPWIEALEGALEDVDLRGLPAATRVELNRLLPGSGEPPEGARDHTPDPGRLVAVMSMVVRHLSRERPVVVVLEDLHWADDTTIRLVSSLSRDLAHARLLIAVTIRSEELHDVPLLARLLAGLGREDAVTRITLGALSRTETGHLVRALAPASAAARSRALEERVWALSRGHPFMAVEAVHAVEEGGRLEPARGSRTPPRVRDLLVGRLSRLGERSRQLAAVAAVIGRPFDFALLQRVGGLAEAETAGAVEELSRRHVLGATNDLLDFTHEQIREVAYAQILPPVRKALHAAVARGIESLHGERLAEHSAALGVHYRESEAWEAAVGSFRRAGRHAAGRAAHREAVECFEHALAALDHLPASDERRAMLVDLCFDLRNSLTPLGAADAVVARLRQAEAAAHELGDGHRLGWVASYQAFQWSAQGSYRRAADSAREALAAGEAARDDHLRAHASYGLAIAAYSLGEYHEAITSARTALAVLPPGAERRPIGGATLPGVLCRAYLALSLAEVGEFSDATRAAEDGRRLAQDADHRYSAAAMSFTAGLARAREDRYDLATAEFDRGLALCRAGEFAVLEPFLAAGLGMAHAHTGRAEEGVALLERAAGEGVGHGFRLWLELLELWLADAYRILGQPEGAEKHGRRALETARERQARGVEAWALRALGLVVARKDRAAGERALREALALAEALGMRPLSAWCHLELGRLHHALRRPAAARQAFETASALFTAIGLASGAAQAAAGLSGAVVISGWSRA